MDINYISPYIRVAMDSIITPPWKLYERVIFDYELLYIKSGIVKITIDNITYEGKEGDIFLFKPKQRHSIEIIGNQDFWQPHIHFDFFYDQFSKDIKVSFKPLKEIDVKMSKYFRDDITSTDTLYIPNKIKINNIKYFEDMLFAIIYEYRDKMPFYELNSKGLFIKLFTFLLNELHYNHSTNLDRDLELTCIKNYITSNLDRELTLEELSAKFNISKYHLLRLFNQYFNVTPIKYHKLLRIELAKERIKFSNNSLTNIAKQFGFTSINAFSRAFRNVEGVAPSYYKQKSMDT